MPTAGSVLPEVSVWLLSGSVAPPVAVSDGSVSGTTAPPVEVSVWLLSVGGGVTLSVWLLSGDGVITGYTPVWFPPVDGGVLSYGVLPPGPGATVPPVAVSDGVSGVTAPPVTVPWPVLPLPPVLTEPPVEMPAWLLSGIVALPVAAVNVLFIIEVTSILLFSAALGEMGINDINNAADSANASCFLGNFIFVSFTILILHSAKY